MNSSNVVIGVSYLSIAILLVILSIPLYLGNVRMNRFYGARFKKSFSSEKNWYKINRYAAKQMIGWSLLLFLTGIAAFLVDFGANGNVRTGLTIAFLSVPLIAAFAPLILTYLYARRL